MNRKFAKRVYLVTFPIWLITQAFFLGWAREVSLFSIIPTLAYSPLAAWFVVVGVNEE